MPSRLIGQLFFLPKNTYKDCSSLYDFCRTVDNIADDKNDLDIKIKKLSEFKSQFLNKNFDSLVIKKYVVFNRKL